MKHLRFVALGLCVVIVLALVVFVWLPEQVVFGIKLESATREGVVGDVFAFTVVVLNPEGRSGEVVLLHELIKNKVVVAQKRVVTSVVRTQDVAQEFSIPDVEEGEYVLRTTASMESVTKSAELFFSIKKEKKETLRVQKKPGLEEVEVSLPVVKRQEVQVQKQPVRIIERSPLVVRKEGACGDIPLSRRDSCLFRQALEEKELQSCEFILDAVLHDACALSLGVSDCGLLRDVRNREVCEISSSLRSHEIS